MKNLNKSLSMLLGFISVAFLNGCSCSSTSWYDTNSHDANSINTINLTVEINKLSITTTEVVISNNNHNPTGIVSYTLVGGSGFDVYFKDGSSQYCTPTLCPNACVQNDVINANQSCTIYVNALNSFPQNGELAIQNLSTGQTINLNLSKEQNLYMTGNFTNSNGHRYVAEYDGNAWSELPQPPTSFAPNGFNSHIYALDFDNNDNLYIGGYFTNSSGKLYVAKYDGNAWSELPQPPATFDASSPFDFIFPAIFHRGNLYVSGGFRNNDGHRYVAKYDGNIWTELPQPSFGGVLFTPFNSWLYDLNFDRQGLLYAVGNFSISTGKRYVAIYNNQTDTWIALPQPSASINSAGFNGFIFQTRFDDNNIPYIAGNFRNAAGQRYIAKYDDNEWIELPQPLNINSQGFNNVIYSIDFDPSGNLYASGNFTNASGQYYIAKYDGTDWSELPQPLNLNMNGFNNRFSSQHFDAAGNFYIGGLFTDANNKYYVAKYDGTSWSALPQPLDINANGFNGGIYEMKFRSELMITEQ